MKRIVTTIWVGLSITLLTSTVTPSDARQWRTTPHSQAQDYTIIVDQRSKHELVVIFWLAPPLVPEKENSGNAREVLRRNLVIGVAHADISHGAQFSFREIGPPAITTDIGFLAPIRDEDISPVAQGGMATVKAIFTQALGKLGAGTKWFVFDGRTIDSCGPGQFWVEYDDEQYDYKTPIPGCPK